MAAAACGKGSGFYSLGGAASAGKETVASTGRAFSFRFLVLSFVRTSSDSSASSATRGRPTHMYTMECRNAEPHGAVHAQSTVGRTLGRD